MRRFARLLPLAVMLLAAPSCRVSVPGHSETVRDSVRVEYRERIVWDTARVEVPVIREVNVTRDTSSHLENGFCSSDARIQDGMLYHGLETKPQTIRVPVPVHVHDTLIVREKGETVTETVTVEAEKPIPWWDAAAIAIGRLTVIVLLVLAVLAAVRRRP